jgi:hypothetical protein
MSHTPRVVPRQADAALDELAGLFEAPVGTPAQITCDSRICGPTLENGLGILGARWP